MEDRVPLHAFAASAGLVFVLLGVGGFVPGITTRYGRLGFAGRGSGALLFGLFQVSVVHNLAHLLLGLGLVAAARASWSRAYLVGGGALLLAAALYGALIDRASRANVLPVNGAGTLLNLALGLAMVALGIVGTRISPPPSYAGDG